MRAVCFVWILAACTRAAAPAPTPTTPTSIPAEDDALRRWKAIAATEAKAPPAGTTAAALVPQLVAYLSSPDPVRRDTIAYDVLTAWLRGGVLSDAEARALMQQLLAGLQARGEVFERSFSALLLGEIVRRDTKQPYLTDDERRAILKAAVDYAGRETDLRGHTGATGWAHAAAHTADLLWRLGQLTAFTDDDRAQILEAVARLVTRRHGVILAYGEDGRLAASVIVAVKNGVPAAAIAAPPGGRAVTIDAWLAQLRAPLVEKVTPVYDAPLFAAQRNARNLLFTLFVQLSVAPARTPGEQALLDGITKLIVE